MSAPLTDQLCTRCGLCCDGILFADVELSGPAELSRLALLGLEVEEDDGEGALLVQPCGALRGKRCSIYPMRPGCCREFECALLQEAGRGDVTPAAALAVIEQALGLVGRAKALLRQLRHRDTGLPLAERAAEAVAAEDDSPVAASRRDELAGVMRELQPLVRRRFLGAAARPTPRRER